MKGADAKAAEVMEQAFAGFETENIARWQLGGNSDFVMESVFALFGGISAGYTIKRFNVGISFLAVHGADAGDWGSKYFHYGSLFIGYDLFTNHRH